MPRVSPFTGLLFDRAHAPSLTLVTTPPYDTITSEQQRSLRAASPYNLVHVDLGEDRAGDDDASNKYTRAARTLEDWRVQGVLVPTDEPVYFPYEMRFVFRGDRRRIRGVIAEVELEPWGGSIVPHERTMPAPVEDRLRLIRAVRANVSPIYAVFQGPCEPLRKELADVVAGEPTLEMTDEAGVEHRLWTLGEAPEFAAWLAEEPLLIADGHHRYTMALRYRDEMRASHGEGPWDRVMMLIVDATLEDPPVLPIHRILLDGDPPAGGERVRDLEEVLAEVDDDHLLVGLATREHGELTHRVLRLSGEPPVVCALHREILDAHAGDLRFTPDAVAAETAVRSGDASAAFFLPPTTAERVRATIDHRRRMPEKSTFFWPKPRTGMVIRPLDAGPATP